MTRGKYATSGDAARARDEAIKEAAELRRRVERLEGQLAEVREERNAKVHDLREQIVRLSRQIDAGTGDALDKARERIKELENDKKTIKAELWSAVESADIESTLDSWRALAAVFGAVVTGTPRNRYMRRFKERNPRFLASIQDQVRGI